MCSDAKLCVKLNRKPKMLKTYQYTTKSLEKVKKRWDPEGVHWISVNNTNNKTPKS